MNNINAINFAYGDIKPWTKFPIFQWDNENIWHIIAKKVLKKSKKLTNLYLSLLLKSYKFIMKDYDNQPKSNIFKIKNKFLVKKIKNSKIFFEKNLNNLDEKNDLIKNKNLEIFTKILQKLDGYKKKNTTVNYYNLINIIND
jgi:hypothetical protein